MQSHRSAKAFAAPMPHRCNVSPSEWTTWSLPRYGRLRKAQIAPSGALPRSIVMYWPFRRKKRPRVEGYQLGRPFGGCPGCWKARAVARYWASARCRECQKVHRARWVFRDVSPH